MKQRKGKPLIALLANPRIAEKYSVSGDHSSARVHFLVVDIFLIRVIFLGGVLFSGGVTFFRWSHFLGRIFFSGGVTF